MAPPSVSSGRGQRLRAHQVFVDGAGGAAAFVDGPDDQRLAAAAVAGGEHARHAGGELAVLGLVVASAGRVPRPSCSASVVLGAEEAHRQQHQVGLPIRLAAGDLVHLRAGRRRRVVHSTCDGPHAARRGRCRRRGTPWSTMRILARVCAELRGRPPRGRSRRGRSAATAARDCRRARSSGGWASSSKLTRLLQPWRIDVPMQSVPVSPPPMTITSLSLALMKSPSVELAVEQALGVGGQELHGEMDALQLAAGDRQVARLGRAGGEQHGVVLVAQLARRRRSCRRRRW